MPSKHGTDSPHELLARFWHGIILNFRASVLTREASIWPDLFKASAHVEARSQQFDCLGPYRLSFKSTVTALTMIAFVWGLLAPVGHYKVPQSACSMHEGILERTVRVRHVVRCATNAKNSVQSHGCEPRASNTREFSFDCVITKFLFATCTFGTICCATFLRFWKLMYNENELPGVSVTPSTLEDPAKLWVFSIYA